MSRIPDWSTLTTTAPACACARSDLVRFAELPSLSGNPVTLNVQTPANFRLGPGLSFLKSVSVTLYSGRIRTVREALESATLMFTNLQSGIVALNAI